MLSINSVYTEFKKKYKKQGWWPLYNHDRGLCEYHRGRPVCDEEIFEIIIGAILTQNVAWKNVEKSIIALGTRNLLTTQAMRTINTEELAGLIKSSGYYNMKAVKIKNFLKWFDDTGSGFDGLMKIPLIELRTGLLSVNGIGPETADSILLYGFGRKIFVVDAYTRRIFSRAGFFNEKDSYQKIQDYFHGSFKGTVKDYNEYHALVVRHAKESCQKKPLCDECCIREICPGKREL